jgi:hypothetical protein
MRNGSLLAFGLTACLLTVGAFGLAPAANAELGGQSSLKTKKIAGKSTGKTAARLKRRMRILLPVGPASVYTEYPYYYSRGYYPRHIGGYVYYPAPFYRPLGSHKQSPRPLR